MSSRNALFFHSDRKQHVIRKSTLIPISRTTPRLLHPPHLRHRHPLPRLPPPPPTLLPRHHHLTPRSFSRQGLPQKRPPSRHSCRCDLFLLSHLTDVVIVEPLYRPVLEVYKLNAAMLVDALKRNTTRSSKPAGQILHYFNPPPRPT